MNKYLLSLGLLLAIPALQAQTAPPAPMPMLTLQASNLNQVPFDPQQLKGKVAVVFFWSTACGVCRDSLPELRANQMGWKDKAFTLVTVNIDKNAADWLAYEQIVARTRPPVPGLVTLWQDTNMPVPGKLPVTLLLNAQGQVVSRFEGRLAPEVWDAVADLLQ